MFSPSLEHILINIIQGDFLTAPPPPQKEKRKHKTEKKKVKYGKPYVNLR